MNFMNMSVADTLDFIAFFAFRCNGTTVLAEIHRVVMQNIEMYRVQSNCFGDSFYEFLYDTATLLFPDVKGVGSCRQNRYTYSSGSNETNWSDHQGHLLELCTRYYKDPNTVKTKKALKQCTQTVLHDLCNAKDPTTKKTLYCGIGAMGAIQFVHIASLIGLIPLHCFTLAELIDDNLGPPRFIRRALNADKNTMPLKKCNDFFNALHHDFSKIWGSLITPSLIENTLCELSRAYKATSKQIKKNNPDSGEIKADIIMDPSSYADGCINDVTFKDEVRNQIQNFFLVRTQGSDGACELRPMLVMRVSKNWTDTNAHVTVTNWCMDKNDKKHMQWEHSPLHRTLSTKLKVSRKIHDIMKIDAT